MKKLIELDAALDALREVIVPQKDIGFGDELTDGYNDVIKMAVTVVSELPTVDAVPVVHSEWIPKEKADTPYVLEMECAKCGFSVIVNVALHFKFCPHCGAKMDGKDGDHAEGTV